MTGTALTQAAFSLTFGSFGKVFIAICMLFFAFSTILGWYFFGQVNFNALFGSKYTKVYSLIVVLFILIGSSLKVDLVWALADFFNGLMAVPNLLALLALSGVVAGIARNKRTDLALWQHNRYNKDNVDLTGSPVRQGPVLFGGCPWHKQKSLSSRMFRLVAGLVFCWMLLLNCLTPYLADDYTFAYAFDTGERLHSLPQLISSLVFHYHEWSGRVIVKFLPRVHHVSQASV